MGRKRNMITDDATASDSSQNPKRQRGDGDTGEDEDSGTTKRGSRNKNFKVPNPIASERGTKSAQAQGKKSSKQKVITETFIPMVEPRNSNHERVVFIDNDSKQPVYALYRKTEGAEPMAHLWADFLQQIQSLRDQIGADTLISTLSEEEIAAIDLKNNAHIFPTLITRAGALRSKDNLEAATTSARNTGGKFGGTATVTGADILRSRATSMRKKAMALNKQAEAYEKKAEQMKPNEHAPEETPLAKIGMTYIGDSLSLNRKEFNKFILDHEEHLTVTAEKLRSEMATLAVFVHKAEKRLRNDIQLKVAADYKLCRDIKLFGKFEVQAWQMGALPTGAHICWCDQCTGSVTTGDIDKVSLKYPLSESGLPEPGRDDALPQIKMEEEDEDASNVHSAPLASTRTEDDHATAEQDATAEQNEDASATGNDQPASLPSTRTEDDHGPAPLPSTRTEDDHATTEQDATAEQNKDTSATVNAEQPAPLPSTRAEDDDSAAVDAIEVDSGDDEEWVSGDDEEGDDEELLKQLKKKIKGFKKHEGNDLYKWSVRRDVRLLEAEKKRRKEEERTAGTAGTLSHSSASTPATVTNQGDQDNQGGEGNTEEEDDVLRHNDAAIDRIAAENRARFPRVAGRGGTGHLRGAGRAGLGSILFSNVYEDAKEMEFNAGYD